MRRVVTGFSYGVLALAVSLAACTSSQPRTNITGKGGLPTNQVGEGTGTAGAVVSIPPELMYPGAVEVEGRPMFYDTKASGDTVKAWILQTLPGAAQVDESNKNWQTFRGTEWTIELYDNSGTATIRYMSNKFLPKTTS